MQLSEAIREGSKLHPKTRYVLAHEGAGGQISTCAMGAAYEAVFGTLPEVDRHYAWDETHTDYARLQDEFPFLSTLLEEAGQTPQGTPFYSIQSAIAHMNDSDDMTREEIADWLEARGY